MSAAKNPRVEVVEGPPTPIESGRSNIIILLLSGILLTIFGILFGYAYGIKQLDEITSNIQTIITGKPATKEAFTKETSPSAKQLAIDATKDWETYEDDNSTFSFRYPTDASLISPTSVGGC